jgi:effector-binding domain-containing protein
MRILKYIFLLLLLASFGLAVFIATQKGDFDVTRSKVINVSDSIAFEYVNDLKNLKSYNTWSKPELNPNYKFSKKTTGIGSNSFWKDADNQGNIKTIATKENKSISQKMTFAGYDSEINWKFKDTIGGTKITYRTKGILPFGLKVYTFVNGGADKVIGNKFMKSLAQLDKSIHTVVPEKIIPETIEKPVVEDIYNINVDGLVTKISNYYAYIPINSKISNIDKNFKILVPKIEKFLIKNSIVKTGKPFIIYKTYQIENDFSNFWVCIPVNKEYLINNDSEIMMGKSPSYQALKTTLKGNSSHIEETYGTIEGYIKENSMVKDTIPFIELYNKSALDTKDANQWITKVYIPITNKKAVAKTLSVKKKIKSNSVKLYPDTPTTSTSEQPKSEAPKKQEEVPNYEGDN